MKKFKKVLFLSIFLCIAIVLLTNLQALAAAPSIPTGVTVSTTQTSLTISWNAVSGATQYTVSANGDHRVTTATSYTYSPLPSNTRYEINVNAGNSNNEWSNWSPSQFVNTLPSTAPSVPTGVTVSTTQTSVTVNWNAVSGATQYTVSANGDHRVTTATSFTYSGLPSNTSYEINVNAGNSSNQWSSWSPSQFVKTLATATTVTITWNAEGGSVSPTSSSLKAGTNFGSLPTPTKAGYSFGGWFTGTSGTGSQITASSVVPSSNTTYYAKWTATTTTYSITVSCVAGTASTNRAEFYTTSAATVQSTSLTAGSDPALYDASGSRIADDEAGAPHWRYTTVANTHYYAGTFSNGAATYTITSTAPITLVRNGSTASTTYTITISCAAGTAGTNRAEFYTTSAATVQSTSLTSGSDPALYDASGSRIADDEAGAPHWKYTTVANTHYYAGTYGNGAATYTITSTAPITLVRNGSTARTTVTVTWNADGGSVSPATSSLTAGTTFGSLPTPTKAGYSFGGWFTGTSGTGTQITTSSVVPSSNTTYYAKWTATTTTYTITISCAAGTASTNRAAFYTTSAATVQSTSLTSGSDPALYDASGSRIADDEAGSSHWKYTTIANTHYYAGTYGNGAATYTITSTAPITLVRNGSTASTTVTITWNADGGSVSPATSSLTAGTTFGSLLTPTKAGYSFGGWFTGTSGTGTQITTSSVVPSSNTTYYAKWTATTPAAVPSVPTGVIISTTRTSVTISWNAVSGATQYTVSANGDHRVTTATSFTYSPLPSGTRFEINVNAGNSSNQWSNWSPSQFVQTLPAVTIAPLLYVGIANDRYNYNTYAQYTDNDLQKILGKSPYTVTDSLGTNEFVICGSDSAYGFLDLVTQTDINNLKVPGTIPYNYLGNIYGNATDLNNFVSSLTSLLTSLQSEKDRMGYNPRTLNALADAEITLAKRIWNIDPTAKVWFSTPTFPNGVFAYKYNDAVVAMIDYIRNSITPTQWTNNVPGIYYGDEYPVEYYTKNFDTSKSDFSNPEVNNMLCISNRVHSLGKQMLWIPYCDFSTDEHQMRIANIACKTNIFDQVNLQVGYYWGDKTISQLNQIELCVSNNNVVKLTGTPYVTKTSNTKIGVELEVDTNIATTAYRDRFNACVTALSKYSCQFAFYVGERNSLMNANVYSAVKTFVQ